MFAVHESGMDVSLLQQTQVLLLALDKHMSCIMFAFKLAHVGKFIVETKVFWQINMFTINSIYIL